MNEVVKFRVTVGGKIVGEFDLSQVEYRQMALHRGNKTPEEMASARFINASRLMRPA